MMRPDAFAAVMATGIVSIAAADHDLDVISAALAAVAAVALPVLVVAAARAWRRASTRRDVPPDHWIALAAWLLTLPRFVHPHPRPPRVTVRKPRV